MPTICDTHVLLFWADRPERLTATARAALDAGRAQGDLACCDISLWEIALLFRQNRLVLPTGYTTARYMDDIVRALGLTVFPLTPAIAALAESGIATGTLEEPTGEAVDVHRGTLGGGEAIEGGVEGGGRACVMREKGHPAASSPAPTVVACIHSPSSNRTYRSQDQPPPH